MQILFKYFKIIVGCIVFITFIIFVISQLKINSRCVTYKEFYSISLHGIIINKYIDSSQHSYNTLEIKDFGNSEVKKILLDFDTTNLFDKIQINDTMYKEINKDSVFVIKNKEKKLLSIVDFACDSL